MAGKSQLSATDEQHIALKAMASGADRAEADRARTVLLTLSGWTRARIAEAFGVREDTVRLWRSDFQAGGIEAVRTKVACGPLPVKAQAALKVAGPLLAGRSWLGRWRTGRIGRWRDWPGRSSGAKV